MKQGCFIRAPMEGFMACTEVKHCTRSADRARESPGDFRNRQTLSAVPEDPRDTFRLPGKAYFNLVFPDLGAGAVNGFTMDIHGDGYRHILHFKLVDGLHTQLRKTQYF